MKNFIIRHKETLLMAFAGLVVMACLNIMMLQYNYEAWTNPKAGFWSAFFSRFEISGFDAYTYIIISKWRPLYVITRHPLLSFMMWPLAQLNHFLMQEFHTNCAIFIVAAVWTLLALASWLLTFRIMRRTLKLSFFCSALLTAWFFSYSHIMLVTFTPDHMAITLPLLLLTVFLAGKAIENKRPMPLWQSLPLAFFATGVTTTNIIKVLFADAFTQWRRKSFSRIMLHFALYIIPLGVIAGLYFYQTNTTQAEETASNERQMQKKAAKDSKFAAEWKKQKEVRAEVHAKQLINLPFVTNTEHYIDRGPSLVENIFGEGIVLHEDYALMDSNKTRPVLVQYRHWWFYAIEAITALLFIAGIWYGRRQRLMWLTLAMFLFDMLLHVGLQFASADAYIMTAHWAFVIPIAVAYLLKATEERLPRINFAVQTAVVFLAVFQWVHNLSVIIPHIMG